MLTGAAPAGGAGGAATQHAAPALEEVRERLGYVSAVFPLASPLRSRAQPKSGARGQALDVGTFGLRSIFCQESAPEPLRVGENNSARSSGRDWAGHGRVCFRKRGDVGSGLSAFNPITQLQGSRRLLDAQVWIGASVIETVCGTGKELAQQSTSMPARFPSSSANMIISSVLSSANWKSAV